MWIQLQNIDITGLNIRFHFFITFICFLFHIHTLVSLIILSFIIAVIINFNQIRNLNCFFTFSIFNRFITTFMWILFLVGCTMLLSFSFFNSFIDFNFLLVCWFCIGWKTFCEVEVSLKVSVLKWKSPIFNLVLIYHSFEIFKSGWRFPSRLIFGLAIPFNFVVRFAADKLFANNLFRLLCFHSNN